MPLIQSVERALKILDLFDEFNTELKITEISSKLDLNKSTAHSILKTLKQYDYIKQNVDTGKYSLGMKLIERGNFVMNSIDVRSIAKKYLLDLSQKTGNTTHLVVLDGKVGVYIDKVEGPNKTIVYSRIGRSVPIHSSAVGKALVAFKSEDDIASLLKDYHFYKQTEKTITNKEAYLTELKQTVKNGYSVDVEENEEGVYCIAVPLYDHTSSVIAAISMSFPSVSVTDDLKQGIAQLLKETSLKVSEQLGYKQTIHSTFHL